MWPEIEYTALILVESSAEVPFYPSCSPASRIDKLTTVEYLCAIERGGTICSENSKCMSAGLTDHQAYHFKNGPFSLTLPLAEALRAFLSDSLSRSAAEHLCRDLFDFCTQLSTMVTQFD